MIARSIERSNGGFTSRLFDHLWAALLSGCAELGGVNWEWQAADAAMSKARLGGCHRA